MSEDHHGDFRRDEMVKPGPDRSFGGVFTAAFALISAVADLARWAPR